MRGTLEDAIDGRGIGQARSQVLQSRDELIERGANVARIRCAHLAPHIGRARREPGGVNEASACEPQAARRRRLADDLHQRAYRQLRQMAQECHQSIVLFRVHRRRPCAEAFHKT